MSLTPEQERGALMEEHARAVAAYRSSQRSPLEHRVTDEVVHAHSLQRKLGRVLDLEREIRRLNEIIKDDAA